MANTMPNRTCRRVQEVSCSLVSVDRAAYECPEDGEAPLQHGEGGSAQPARNLGQNSEGEKNVRLLLGCRGTWHHRLVEDCTTLATCSRVRTRESVGRQREREEERLRERNVPWRRVTIGWTKEYVTCIVIRHCDGTGEGGGLRERK